MKTLIQQIKEQQSTSLNNLIAWAGNRSILARTLGTSPQVVAHWVKRGRISAKMAVVADIKTNSSISKEQLRPDVITWEDK